MWMGRQDRAGLLSKRKHRVIGNETSGMRVCEDQWSLISMVSGRDTACVNE